MTSAVFSLNTGGMKDICVINVESPQTLSPTGFQYPLQEDIEHMVQEAEKYKAKDKQRDKVSSKNLPESCAFNMKATAEDEKLQGKINDEDKQEIPDKCNEITNWLAKNQTAEKEECEHRQKELEKVCTPLIMKLHGAQEAMPGGTAGGFPGGGAVPPGAAFPGTIVNKVD